jgi:hypothetical protein
MGGEIGKKTPLGLRRLTFRPKCTGGSGTAAADEARTRILVRIQEGNVN